MNLKIIGILALAAALATGCSKDDAEDIVNNIENDPEITGSSFVGNCIGSDLTDFSVQDRLTFGGNDFSRELIYYRSEDCSSGKGGSVVLKGDYRVDADGLNKPDGGALEIKHASASVSIDKLDKTDQQKAQKMLADALNATKFCGREDYEVGQTKDITGGTDNVLCPVRSLPETIYGAYKVEDNLLYLNEGGFREVSNAKNERPEDLDTEFSYARE